MVDETTARLADRIQKHGGRNVPEPRHFLLRPDGWRRGASELIHQAENSAGNSAAHFFGKDRRGAAVAPQTRIRQQRVVPLEVAGEREGRGLYACVTKRSETGFEFRVCDSGNGVAIRPDEMREPPMETDLLGDGRISKL